MRIALFGKPFKQKHNDAVQHLVDRIQGLDSEALVYAEFMDLLNKSTKVPSTFKTFSCAEDIQLSTALLISRILPVPS